MSKTINLSPGKYIMYRSSVKNLTDRKKLSVKARSGSDSHDHSTVDKVNSRENLKIQLLFPSINVINIKAAEEEIHTIISGSLEPS